MRLYALSSPNSVSKYFTFLITLFQSTQLESLFILDENPDRIGNFPVVFHDLQSNPRWNFFSRSLGYTELLWCTIGRLYDYDKMSDHDATVSDAIKKIIYKACRKLMPHHAENRRLPFLDLPSTILSLEARRYIIEIWVPGMIQK